MNAGGKHACPAFRVAVLYAGGTLLGAWMPRVPGAMTAAVVALLLCGSLVLWYTRKRDAVSIPISLLAGVLCLMTGAANMTLREEDFRSLPWPVARDTTIVGRIVEPPLTAGRVIRFILRPSAIEGVETRFLLGGDLLVTVGLRKSDSAWPALAYGALVGLRGSIREPPSRRNPGEFDSRAYYRANGIVGLMRVRGCDNVAILDTEGGSWPYRTAVLPVRTYTLGSIERFVGGEEGEFLKGLLVGVRSGLSRETRTAFVNSGVAHILAVSGSNVAVVAGFLVVGLGLFRIPRAARMVITSIGLLLYMAATGSQPPVVRATIMALVLTAGTLAGRPPNPFNALGVSALLMLIIEPVQLFDVGFQLSFVAVISILAFYPRVNSLILRIHGDAWHISGLRWILQLSALSLVASVGTLPIGAASFGKVSVIGLLANIIVVPASGISVVLGLVQLLAGTVSESVAAMYAAANWLILHWTLVIARVAGNLPFAFVDTLTFNAGYTVPYYLAVLIVFGTIGGAWGRRLGILLFSLLVVSLSLPVAPRKEGVLRVSFIDVGQGDAILAEFPDGKTMLIDAGPKIGDYDAGEQVVVPFLKRRGIRRLDLLVVTHPHDDHAGGVPAVAKSFAVGRMVGVGPSNDTLAWGTNIREFQGARVYVLAPGRLAGGLRPMPGRWSCANNASIVLRVLFGRVAFLLPGDAELPIEHALCRRYGDFLRSEVLKLGHHGSWTSSGEEFLASVRPRYAVISVGILNSFDHPSEGVLERLERIGIAVSRTDEGGAVIFETDGEEVHRLEWR